MNNLELRHCLSTNKITKKNFKGVYPANKLLELKIKNGLYIANTQPLPLKGQHWIAISVEPDCVEIFDSSGVLFLKNKYFEKFIKKCNRKFIFNTKMIQDPKSNICGQYCLIFAFFKGKGKSLCEFLKIFNDNLIKNDQLILSLYKKHFKKPICKQYSKSLYLCV